MDSCMLSSSFNSLSVITGNASTLYNTLGIITSVGSARGRTCLRTYYKQNQRWRKFSDVIHLEMGATATYINLINMFADFTHYPTTNGIKSQYY